MVKTTDDRTFLLPVPCRGCWWVLPGELLAGPAAALPELLSGDWIPQRVLDLREEGSARGVEGLERRHLPVTDFGLPDPVEAGRACAWLEQGLARGERGYLHCQAGCGRSGVLAGAFLLRRGIPAEEVLPLLARRRREADLHEGCPETEAQRAWLRTGAPGLPLPEPRK